MISFGSFHSPSVLDNLTQINDSLSVAVETFKYMCFLSLDQSIFVLFRNGCARGLSDQ